MVATELSRYLQEMDKNGAIVKTWAVQTAPGIATSKVCVPKTTIKFGKGKKELTNHSESAKHQRCAIERNPKILQQPDIFTAMTQTNEKRECQEKAREFEIALLQGLSRHGIPPENASCLTNLMKKYITDSEIVKELKLGTTKTKYVTTYGLGKYYQNETISKMKNCDAFSIQIDESEVNKVSQLLIRVNMAISMGIEKRHYKCVDLDSCDAASITSSLLEAFDEDNIDAQLRFCG